MANYTHTYTKTIELDTEKEMSIDYLFDCVSDNVYNEICHLNDELDDEVFEDFYNFCMIDLANEIIKRCKKED